MASEGNFNMACDRLWRNAKLVTLARDDGGLGLIEAGAVASL